MANFYGRVGIQLKDTVAEGAAELLLTIRPAVLEAVMAAGEVIRASAYEKANVSGGARGHGRDGEHMRDEIKVVPFEYETGVSARIQIDMSVIPYAAHQEFGPRGKPFMRPAVDENREQCHEVMGKVLAENMVVHGVRTKVRFRSFA